MVDPTVGVIRKVSVAEQVAQELIRQIESGVYKQGDKLPPQQSLEKQMGVSRPTLREALSRLVESGYVEAHQGRGYFVKQPEMAIDIRLPYDISALDKKSLEELFEARLVVESSLAVLACIAATEEECEKLREAAAEEHKERENREVNRFHKLVAACSHNDLLAEFGIALVDRFNELYSSKYHSLSSPEWNEKYALVPHRQIAEDIAAHDTRKAYYDSMMHILNYTRDMGLLKKYEAFYQAFRT